MFMVNFSTPISPLPGRLLMTRNNRGALGRMLAAACVALVVAALPSGVAAATTSAASSSEGVYVVILGDESFSSAVIRAAKMDAGYRAQVAKLLPTWEQSAHMSKGLGLPTLADRTSSEVSSDFQRIRSWLANPASVPTYPSNGFLGGSTGGPLVDGTTPTPAAAVPQTGSGQSNVVAPQSARGSGDSLDATVSPMWSDPNNPGSFPVRGYKGANGNTYWVQLNNAIAVAFCASSCRETDRLTTRSTVNPGAVDNKISTQMVYSPNSGNINSYVDLQYKSINKGTVTGTGNSAMKPGEKIDYHGNGRKLNGTVLTISVAVGTEIMSPPYNGRQVWDGGRTADATCNKTNNVCRY